jgi:hypothetical protein
MCSIAITTREELLGEKVLHEDGLAIQYCISVQEERAWGGGGNMAT